MKDRPDILRVQSLLADCMIRDRLRLQSRVERLIQSSPPERVVERIVEDLHARAAASARARAARLASFPKLSYPAELPISSKRSEIVQAIRENQVLIVAGETGSGKTTQLPKMCLEAGLGSRGKIGCTQPRRVAALSISRRIAAELNVEWGKAVGCKIRFNDDSGPETLIKMMTDGILLAETQGDPLLSEYEAIIVDEAHERSLNIDFLLGYLKLLLSKRPDLKLVITSATIDTEAFSRAFGGAPVIEVSGRLYPVEVVYAPLDEMAEEEGELTYIDAAARMVERIDLEFGAGDILVFLPSESDIRELRDQLQGRFGQEAEVIPLFGRLAAADQQKVFATFPRRKIVLATNIAETSLTIPGIRYVIDSGLARISRYNPRTRTKRLPIEPISQSSANQRMGRCGRVENGICIRLYSEEDFLARPKFTQPEIQRSNLAEVILRMKAFRLGEIETFPFLNPPTSQAIRSGYGLLQELGALDSSRELTPLGRDLARLPIDPTAGRMIWQALREGALPEVLVIAAGLSIQDPRERPMDRKELADAAHKRFAHPESDFLTLLNIWNAYHDEWESLRTQNQMRKFCKAHFLSYNRLREWRDLHAQLEEVVQELEGFSSGANDRRAAKRENRENRSDVRNGGVKDPYYAAIHRSILTGLLGHVGQKQESNVYKTSGNRTVMVFPGSSLFARNAKSGKGGQPGKEKAKRASDTFQPEWMMAGEIMETSRLFARTVAAVDPVWIVELGAHLCKSSFENPHWNEKAGRVLVRERIRLFGLEVHSCWVPLAKVDPAQATSIFIRSALVEGALDLPHRFLEHNRQLRQKIEIWQTRMRHGGLVDLDRAFFNFYASRLKDVSSIHDLNRVVKDSGDPQFLCATEADIVGDREIAIDSGAFPTQVQFGQTCLPLTYAYAPGEAHDGVTLKLPAALAPSLEARQLDWLVPGLQEERIECLLRSLPKALRRELMPLADTAREIAATWKPEGGSLTEELSRHIHRRYGILIPLSAWRPDTLPEHLRIRVELVGNDQQVIAAGRDLTQLKEELKTRQLSVEQQAWKRAVEKWERYGLTGWTFGDLPERIEVEHSAGFPVYAYPGLQLEEGEVNLRLFRTREEAEASSGAGLVRLGELALQRELAWLQKDLRALDAHKDLYVTLGPAEELKAGAYANLRDYLFARERAWPLEEALFRAAVEQAQRRLPGLADSLAKTVGTILGLRQQALLCQKPYPGLRMDLDALIPKDFLRKTPYERLAHLVRYLKAMLVRAERAAVNPPKDREKLEQVRPFIEALARLRAKQPGSAERARQVEEFRWMVEELKVSIFAQELGTAFPVSPRRLEKQLETWEFRF